MCLTHQACHFVRVRPCNSPGSKILRVRGADVSIKPGARAPGSHQEKQSSLRSGRQPHHFNQLLSPTAIARSAGSCLSFTSDPGVALAKPHSTPGFTLSPASRARLKLWFLKPGAHAPGFMLTFAPRTERKSLYDLGHVPCCPAWQVV